MSAMNMNRRGFPRSAGDRAGLLRRASSLPRSAGSRRRAGRSGSKLERLHSHRAGRFRHASSSTKPRWGRAPSRRFPCCWPRNWSATGTRCAPNFAPVDPALYGHAGRVRQPEHPHLLDAAAPGRRDGAREMLIEAAAQNWSVDQVAMPHGKRLRRQPATNARLSYGSWRKRRRSCRVPDRRRAEGPEAVPAHRQAGEAARHARQGQRPARSSASTRGCPA